MRLPVRSVRKAHRWLGLCIGVQLLLWTASGLYFSLNPIERVRGEDLAARPAVLDPHGPAVVSPGPALDSLRRAPGVEAVEHVLLRPLLGRPVYEIAYRRDGQRRIVPVDAGNGRLRPPLTREEALGVARADFLPEVPIQSLEYVESAPAGGEYRGGVVPAYRITFADDRHTRLYVSAARGVVTARRNATWRTFDFLWMLHIMDYETRDDFNHLLLRIVSALGVVTVLSGFLLWGITTPVLRRGRRPPGEARGRGEPARPPS